eukprot:SAG22_NODE_5788_length_952_cov_1.264947_1_plen_257_part_10
MATADSGGGAAGAGIGSSPSPPPLDIPARSAGTRPSVDLGVAGMTPKAVMVVPNLLPPEFSLDGDDGGGEAGLARPPSGLRRSAGSAIDLRRSSSRAVAGKPRRKSSGRSSWTGLRHSGSNSDLAVAATAASCAGGGDGLDDVEPLLQPALSAASRKKASSAPDLQALKRGRGSGRPCGAAAAAASAVSDRSVFRPMAAVSTQRWRPRPPSARLSHGPTGRASLVATVRCERSGTARKGRETEGKAVTTAFKREDRC